jgi:hypothetical protein
MKEKFGAPYWFAHRVDLSNELKRLASASEGTGKAVELCLRKEVVGYVSSIINVFQSTSWRFRASSMI